MLDINDGDLLPITRIIASAGHDSLRFAYHGDQLVIHEKPQLLMAYGVKVLNLLGCNKALTRRRLKDD